MTVLKTNTTKNKVEVEKLCRPIANISLSIEHYPELPQSDQLATYARFECFLLTSNLGVKQSHNLY